MEAKIAMELKKEVPFLARYCNLRSHYKPIERTIMKQSMEQNENSITKRKKQLDYKDRLVIERLVAKARKDSGYKIRFKIPYNDIAGALGVSEKTIRNEFKRGEYLAERGDGRCYRMYSPSRAQDNINEGKKSKGRRPFSTTKGTMYNKAIKLFISLVKKNYYRKDINENECRYSVWAACIIVNNKFPDVCFKCSTMYYWIKNGYITELTLEDVLFFKRKKKKQHKKATSPHKNQIHHSISQRPKEENERIVNGSYEGDTVVSRARCTATVVTITNRTSRMMYARVVGRNTKQCFHGALNNILKDIDELRSITFDNGSEFAGTERILEIMRHKSSDAQIYYAHPYRSWERGSNERNNGLLRRAFPKGTNFANISQDRLQRTIDFINNYPRTIFGGLSASKMEVLNKAQESQPKNEILEINS